MISLVIFIFLLFRFYVDQHYATLLGFIFSAALDLHLTRSTITSVHTHATEIAAAEVGGKQWCILCMALLVALGTGVGVGLPLALRSGSSLQERLIAAQNILAQVPLIDG
jgi:hypothetical protein